MIKTQIQIQNSNRNVEALADGLELARLFPDQRTVAVRLRHQMAAKGLNPHRRLEVDELHGTREETAWNAKMTFFQSIRDELGLNQEAQLHADLEQREIMEYRRDKGLTTECNTKDEHVCLADTLESCTFMFAKHKGVDLNAKLLGAKGEDTRPFTADEDEEAARLCGGPLIVTPKETAPIKPRSAVKLTPAALELIARVK